MPGRMTENVELERLWKEVVLAYLNTIPAFATTMCNGPIKIDFHSMLNFYYRYFLFFQVKNVTRINELFD
jgi:hypothetical protein